MSCITTIKLESRYLRLDAVPGSDENHSEAYSQYAERESESLTQQCAKSNNSAISFAGWQVVAA